MSDQQKQVKQEPKLWAGDILRCNKCGCEIRVLKAGQSDLVCCNHVMEIIGGLNPATSF